ncbi:MAG: glycosyltransferase family 4 protein [Geminicoccaceae bacterium]|nr:glycosyltransferase family 4 protein [Geminicoccaceae bacterium]
MERPLDILVVAACPFPYPRGTPIRILRTAEALLDRGHRVRVVTYHLGRGEADPRLAIARLPRGLGYRKTSPGPSIVKLVALDPQLAWILRKELEREPADVLYAHHYEGLLVASAARVGLRPRPPLVFDLHTLLASELPSYLGGLPSGLVRRWALAIDRRLPRRADHLTTVTDRIRDKLIGELGVPAERVTTVANGVEVDHFASVPPAGPIAGDRAPRILFTGNPAPYQRLDLLLEAFAKLAGRYPSAELVLSLDGDIAALRARIAALGIAERVSLRPAVPFAELPALLAEADIAANPRTDADGTPVKLLNYMAAGRPIVSFAGSAPGLVDGETALLCPDGDTDCFARAMLRLIEDRALAARLGAAARAHVDRSARWSRAAETLERVMRALVTPAPHREAARTPA